MTQYFVLTRNKRACPKLAHTVKLPKTKEKGTQEPNIGTRIKLSLGHIYGRRGELIQ